MEDPKRKRPRLELAADAAIALAERLLKALVALYGDMPQESLWDTSRIQTLLQPTAYHGEEATSEFRYIGRAGAKALLSKMQALGMSGKLQVQGAKGSGKSTAVSAAVGYLLGKENRKVVYICAARYLEAPIMVLRHAFLVATRGSDPSLASFTNKTEFEVWCAGELNIMLFVVDDWDSFELYPDEAKALMGMVGFHALVRLSSTNSRERQIREASDKKPPPLDFDGPYSPPELSTWIAQSNLTEDKLELLGFLTGGMPGLLRFYEEVEGDPQRFRDLIDPKYTIKLFDRLIRPQSTRLELAAVLQMVTAGVRGAYIKQPVDLTCFYKEKDRFRLLSPYLRSRAENYIMDQQKALQCALDYTHIQDWAAVVRKDCVARGRNSPLAGWNVEGLVIAVMRYQGKLFCDDGFPFQHYNTYEHGMEAELLMGLTEEQLIQGLLVGPIAFNEKAVDVVYLKLDLETGILTVKAVQITISKWKSKRRLKSHKVWQEKVLPKWLSENWTVEHQFLYVMPEKLSRVDLAEVNDTLPDYIAASHAQSDDKAGGSGENDDRGISYYDANYGTVEYENIDLSQVQGKPVEFKTLRQVHSCLLDFDKALLLDEPAKLKKMKVKQCTGQVKENGSLRPCLKWCRTDANAWSCCPGHVVQVAN